jgi:hypothetical protein
MPQVGVARLSGWLPPMVRIVCAFTSWFIYVAEPYLLPGRPEGGLCMRGNAEGPIGTWPTL